MAYLGDADPTMHVRGEDGMPHHNNYKTVSRRIYVTFDRSVSDGDSVDLCDPNIPVEKKLLTIYHNFAYEDGRFQIFKDHLEYDIGILGYLYHKADTEEAKEAVINCIVDLDKSQLAAKEGSQETEKFKEIVIYPLLAKASYINFHYFNGMTQGESIPSVGIRDNDLWSSRDSLSSSYDLPANPNPRHNNRKKSITLGELLPIAINVVNDPNIMKYPDLYATTKGDINYCIEGIEEGIDNYHEHIKKLDRANAVEKLSSYQKNAFDSIKKVDSLPEHKQDKPLG